MFEKEAEEYTLKKLVGLEDFDSYQSAYDRYENGVQDAFKDGAEFGYNKAKEEMQKQGLALQSDMDKTIEQNIQLKKQNNFLRGELDK